MRNRVILYNTFILVILLFVTEIMFRIFGFGFQNAPLENDSYLHHKNPSNYSFKCYTPDGEYGGHNIRFDSLGRRIDEEQKKKGTNNKVWFLGDSFTGAFQVKWKESFVGILDSLPEYTAENLGVSSYSPLLYYLQLKLYLNKKTKPKKVFIQLYSNDIAGDKMYAKHSKFENKAPVFCAGEDPKYVLRLLRKSYIVRVLRKTQLTIQYLLSEKEEELRIENHVEAAAIIDSDSHFCKSILLIKELLESHNIEYYFFAIPSKYACISGNWDSENFAQNTNQFFTKNNISFVNLNQAFRNDSVPSSLFYKKDIHCNERGNMLIAKELKTKL